jgi:polysaccharide export outer membrane protein
MKRVRTLTVLALACCLLQQVLVVAVAQEKRPRVAKESAGQAATTKPGVADDAWSPALTGERRPLYRLRDCDVLEIGFTFAPEFNQTVTIRPDGFITLKGVDELYVQGMTVSEVREATRNAYAATLNDPEVTVVLQDFDKPYFIATGEVTHPGKYELRGDTTVTEALAIAGGFTGDAKHSQVVLFRRSSPEQVEARLLDVKRMLKSRNLEEDTRLMPGDLLFVPQNMISKLKRYVPTSSLGMFWNPAQY